MPNVVVVLRIVLLLAGGWVVVGLGVSLAVGLVIRRAGAVRTAPAVALAPVVTAPAAALAPVVTAPAPALVSVAPLPVDELAIRRARRAGIGVRVASAAAVIGVLVAAGSVQGIPSMGSTPALNVQAPAVAAPQAPPRAAAVRPVKAEERHHAAERPLRAQAAPQIAPEGAPGRSEDAPGHDVAGPGRSEDAPGHDVAGPGRSEDAPGHDVAGPGRSEDAPGRSADAPGRKVDAPGKSADAPGRTADAWARDAEAPRRANDPKGQAKP